VIRYWCFSEETDYRFIDLVDCGQQIIKQEGTKALFKGAGANILRGQ
jgi:hypothetical protein